MPREASARRAEKFARDNSPPKRPSIGPLLTPRAFSGKGGATLLNSSGSLREMLQRAGGHKVDARAGHAERDLATAGSGGLGRTIAALERAAAEAELSRCSPAPAGPRSQSWRRPMLPRLDVEAAAAQAAAEAAEEASSVETGTHTGGWDVGDSSPSPLTSPATSSMASPSPGGYASSSAGSSPERRRAGSPARRAAPGHLSPSRIDNPLWSQSPASQGLPSRGTAAAPPAAAWPAAGRRSVEAPDAPASPSRSHVEHAPEADSPLVDTAAGSAAASPAAGPNLRASLDSVGGGDGGLLESLLCPPALKPAHTRLLGALMHTAAPATESAAAARKVEQLRQLREQADAAQDARQPWEQGGEDEAAPADAALAAGAGLPAHGAPASPSKAAPSQATGAAGDGVPASSSRVAAAGGARRLAMVLLSAVAGAAAVMAAGAVQQHRGSGGSSSGSSSAKRRRPVLRAQPVPSMHGAERRTHSREELEGRQCESGLGGVASPQPAAAADWDSAHARLTQG